MEVLQRIALVFFISAMIGAFALYSYAAYVGHTEWHEDLLELRETKAEVEAIKEKASERWIECIEEVTGEIDSDEIDTDRAMQAAARVVVCNRFTRIEEEAANQITETQETISTVEKERVSRTLLPWR